jgi:predicted porin
MKKYLYATTAIVGASMMATSAHAQGVDLNVGGYINAYYGIADFGGDLGNIDETQEQSFQEVELELDGSVTLDNGLTVGFFAENELEGGTAEADEQYLYFGGGFGTLQLGQQNGAAYSTHAGGSQAYAAGVPINSGWTAFPTAGYNGSFLAPGYSTFGDMQNDNNGVVYYSPRFGGFRLAASWHPEAQGGNAGTGGAIANTSDETEQNNALSAGLQFNQDFNGFSIDASAGFNTEDRPNREDPEQYMFSLGAGVAGFSFGGDVLIEDSDGTDDGESYALGAAYSFGPWTAGINGIMSEIEGNQAIDGDDERTAFTVGLDYALGPGISLSSSVLYEEYDNEEGTDADALAGYLGATVGF